MWTVLGYHKTILARTEGLGRTSLPLWRQLGIVVTHYAAQGLVPLAASIIPKRRNVRHGI
jgi:hypothetical protein